MKYYAHFGLDDFVVALGYKGEVIKRWMVDYGSLATDLTVHAAATARSSTTTPSADDWTVTLVDTGLPTATGGRIKRLAAAPRRRRHVHAHLG